LARLVVFADYSPSPSRSSVNSRLRSRIGTTGWGRATSS